MEILEYLWQMLAAVGLGILGWVVNQVKNENIRRSLEDLVSDAVDAGVERLREKYGKEVDLGDYLPEVVDQAVQRVWDRAPKWIDKMGWGPDDVEDKVRAWVDRRLG